MQAVDFKPFLSFSDLLSVFPLFRYVSSVDLFFSLFHLLLCFRWPTARRNDRRWLALLLLVCGRYCWGDWKGRKYCWWVSFGLWDKEIGEDGEPVVVGGSFWTWWAERGKAGVVLGLFGWLGFVGEREVREEIRFWPVEREDCWSMAGWRGKPRILKDQSRGFFGLAKRRRSREGE